MLDECNRYFDTNHIDIKQCEKTIWNRLSRIERIRQNLLSVFHEYDRIVPQKEDMNTYLFQLTTKKNKLEERFSAIGTRIKKWNTGYIFPFLYRWFHFISFFKRKLMNHVGYFIQPNEGFIDESMNKDEIIAIYSNKAKETREEINNIVYLHNEVNQLNENYKAAIEELINLEILEKDHTLFKSLFEINEYLDTTIKYASFWLAVHYYECRWLTGNRLTEKQKGRNYENVLKRFYSNLSMLAPCFVMTFHQLPKLLLAYNKNEKEHYLYNYIDLLIVDEAGQVTPEIAACSFSLAKKAVVVGDVHQIEPVWNINQSLDMSLALSNRVISSIEEFEKISDLGLNTSESML